MTLSPSPCISRGAIGIMKGANSDSKGIWNKHQQTANLAKALLVQENVILKCQTRTL